MKKNNKNIFFDKLALFIKNKEYELKKSIYVTFNNKNVHLYYRDEIFDNLLNCVGNKNITIGFITYNGNFYKSRKNMKDNLIFLNILN
jgi:hypothetical protein